MGVKGLGKNPSISRIQAASHFGDSILLSKQTAEVDEKHFLRQKLMPGLLNGRCLSVTELGDLYCYRWGQQPTHIIVIIVSSRYGAPVTRALELVTGTRSTLKAHERVGR